MACVICLSSRAEVVCVPCGHVCACAGCLSPTTVPIGSKRTCPICRKGVAQLLKVFSAGASMNNEPPAAPPPVEKDRSRSVCRPVGALLVPVNFISDLRGPRGNPCAHPRAPPMLSISHTGTMRSQSCRSRNSCGDRARRERLDAALSRSRGALSGRSH